MPPQTKPHYYIAKVCLKSFKSVSDHVVEIALVKGLNGIVGANGAGKSTLLSAISFACAAPLNALGVSKLSDLRHSGSTELCHVEVLFKAASSTQTKKSNTLDVTLHACIGADGNRIYHLNGRLITGKELRVQLARLGIHLGTSFSLIRQEAVTELSDATDPLTLAAVVAVCHFPAVS